MKYHYAIGLNTQDARNKLLVMFDWWLTYFVPIAKNDKLIPDSRLYNEISLVDVFKLEL